MSAVFYAMIGGFNLVDQVMKQQSILGRIEYTLPFFIISIIFMTKYKSRADFFIDIILSVLLILKSRTGEFSGIPFIFLLMFRVDKHSHYIILLSGVFVSVLAGSIIHGRSVPGIFLIIALYAFIGAKYFYTIYQPTQATRSRVKELEEKLSHYGPAGELSAQEIKLRYPFMDDRRINDLRLLATGYTAKEIGYENGVSYSWQTREHARMQKEFEKIVNEEIRTTTQLVVVAVKCGIIPVKYITTGLSGDDRW